jgi:lysophospholipase L1-like esterase
VRKELARGTRHATVAPIGQEITSTLEVKALHSGRFRTTAWLAGTIVAIAVAGIILGLRVAPTASARRLGTGGRAATFTAPVPGSHWVATWGASPQPATPGAPSAGGFDDQTVRNIVFTSAGGTMVRVRFTNAFGLRPLRIGRATIGVPGEGAGLLGGAAVPLSFGGRQSVVIPAGADVLSDPAALTVDPLQSLAISIFLPESTGPATQHALARQVNYVATGDHALATSPAPFSTQSYAWNFIDRVDVQSPPSDLGTIVAMGDSITDGVGSTTNANGRWPNDLARRLDALNSETMSVVDEGIGGNRVLNDAPCCGVSALARFNRDALEQPDLRAVILLEGINDIGFSQATGPLTAPHTDVSAAQIIAGYEQLIGLAHAAGVKIFAATLTPFEGSRHWTPAGEVKRETVNQWIRTSGAFDGVIDFAGAVADPADPAVLKPAYDSGDHIHPDDAGYQAMANAISLAALLPAPLTGNGRHRPHRPASRSR